MGGIRSNREAIFESARGCDVIVLLETFLSEQDEANFQIPEGYFSFSNPGHRGHNIKGGRAAGGILVLLKASSFHGSKCKAQSVNRATLVCDLKPKNAPPFKLVACYRSDNSGSAVFEADFFQDLSEICLSASEKGEKALVLGDFNAKIGDASSEIGFLTDFLFLRPENSANRELDAKGKFLLEAISSGNFFLVPFADQNGVYPVTCKANFDRARVTGGSVIDFIFSSETFLEFIGSSGFAFEREISSHAWLEVVITNTSTVTTTGVSATSTLPPPRTVMAFDLDRVFDFEHGEELLKLVNTPGNFSVSEAYTAINSFVGSFTVTETRTRTRSKVDPLDERLQRLRAKTRQIERKLRKATNPQTIQLLEEKMRQALHLWKVEREAVKMEKLTRLRERFHEARRNGQFHLAWKLARLNLGGKGGGVRTSVTTAIDREGWEQHFAGLFRRAGGNLDLFDPGVYRNAVFDDPITGEEVSAALDKKKNMRAPGPDGFRVDFLRFVRYDEVACRAIANFFNLIVQHSEIPTEWDNAFLFVLYKGKGDRADPNNYRGITLKSHFLKLLEAILCSRFLFWAESNSLLPLEQLAYRHGLSGTDHLFLFNILKEQSLKLGRPLFVSLIDLRKAFPSVDREKLLTDLRDAGTSARFVAVMRRLYSRDTFQLLLDGVPGHTIFHVEGGVHEGSCLSPALFIFFIRDLVVHLANIATNLDCPTVGGRKLFCMIYADDLTLFAYSDRGAQALVDGAVEFFLRKGLTPNPGKCEFLVFEKRGSRRSKVTWNVMGVNREEQDSARYLGLFFQSDGKWNLQLQVAASRSRIALGRCKVIASTVGYTNLRLLVNYFDSTVASVYRFGLGVWGVSVAKISTLDQIFANYIRFIFRFPPTTGTNVILSNFSRRCAKCDSLYLAAVQLASWRTTRNTVWSETVQDLVDGRIEVPWFTVVTAELRKRGFEEEVLLRGAEFLADRKMRAVEFSQYCFWSHLNIPVGNSADQIRRTRPFGILPFLLSHSVHLTRFIFAFLCSVWRFIDRGCCSWYPEVCRLCDQENSSFHVLFQCVKFASLRHEMFSPVNVECFCFDTLVSSERPVQKAIVMFGRHLFDEIRNANPAGLSPVPSESEDGADEY